MSAVWERKIHVTVTAPRKQSEARQKELDGVEGWKLAARLELEAEAYELQVGSDRHRELGDGRISQYKFEVGDRESNRTWGEGTQQVTMALIADTPANREALLRINAGMEELGARLRALLAPARVEETLRHVLSGSVAPLALPASSTRVCAECRRRGFVSGCVHPWEEPGPQIPARRKK